MLTEIATKDFWSGREGKGLGAPGMLGGKAQFRRPTKKIVFHCEKMPTEAYF